MISYHPHGSRCVRLQSASKEFRAVRMGLVILVYQRREYIVIVLINSLYEPSYGAQLIDSVTVHGESLNVLIIVRDWGRGYCSFMHYSDFRVVLA